MVVAWNDWADEIARCVRSIPDAQLEHAAKVIASGSLVLTAGNGGSSAIASHAAQAIMKPDYRPGHGRQAVCLTDMVPTLTAHANDGGWQTALVEVARPFMSSRPVLLLISSSGNSENVKRLADNARVSGCKIVGLTGFDGGALRTRATLSIHVDSSDYEVVEPVHDALIHRVQYHLRRGVL